MRAEDHLADAKGERVSADAEEGDDFGPVTAQLGRKPAAAAKQFGSSQLVGRRRRPIDEVGDAITRLEKTPLLEGRELPPGKAGGVQRRPEAVPRAREVVAGGGGIQARVDADKQNREPGRNDVPQSLAAAREQLLAARASAFRPA